MTKILEWTQTRVIKRFNEKPVLDGSNQEFLARSIHLGDLEQVSEGGGNVSGFRESSWSTVQKVERGDILLCYLTGISRFGGGSRSFGTTIPRQISDLAFRCVSCAVTR